MKLQLHTQECPGQPLLSPTSGRLSTEPVNKWGPRELSLTTRLFHWARGPRRSRSYSPVGTLSSGTWDGEHPSLWRAHFLPPPHPAHFYTHLHTTFMATSWCADYYSCENAVQILLRRLFYLPEAYLEAELHTVDLMLRTLCSVVPRPGSGAPDFVVGTWCSSGSQAWACITDTQELLIKHSGLGLIQKQLLRVSWVSPRCE